MARDYFNQPDERSIQQPGQTQEIVIDDESSGSEKKDEFLGGIELKKRGGKFRGRAFREDRI